MAGVGGSSGFTGKTSAHAFLKSVLQNGVGKHVKQLKRITLNFSEASPSSRHVRKFVENDLVEFARKHPSVVVYAMPEMEQRPSVCVEYLNGREEVASLEKLEPDEILQKLDTYSNRSGVEILKIVKDIHTDHPSIQGQWHLFTNNTHNITKKLDYQTKLYDTWEHLSNPWEQYYRQHEKHRLTNRVKLTLEEKKDLPLGKWGPVLKPRY
nr:39S ribosomal protein L43, mitochondrial-like [Ciona intestinalis]|eukprot:XP_009857917.1 39S ribosomal protein L43, mitochondrial-like [Ciona intestinalis]